MPRYGLLLVVLAAAMLDAQSGSNKPTSVDPSQTRPASRAASTPDETPQTPKVEPRVIPLEPSQIPSSLAQAQTDGFPGLLDVMGISLCDPVACLGDAPKFVLVNGKVTIRFPDSYRKPATETKDVAKKEPASPETSGEQGAPRK
jgi:hypothetical protein